MKKNIGAVVGLYPTPVTVVGTVVDGRVNWINIVHVGIVGLDQIMISMGKTHYSNKGIKANKTCSINIVNKALIEAADYVGLYSGKTVDKSGVFPYYFSELENAPLIETAPVAMACIVEDIYETMTHDNFIVRPIHTYVESDYLNEEGQIAFEKVSSILFEMGCKQYMTTGNAIGKGWMMGEFFKK